MGLKLRTVSLCSNQFTTEMPPQPKVSLFCFVLFVFSLMETVTLKDTTDRMLCLETFYNRQLSASL